MDGDQSGCFTIAKSRLNLGDLKEGKKISQMATKVLWRLVEKKKEIPKPVEFMNLHKSNEFSVNIDCCPLIAITIIPRISCSWSLKLRVASSPQEFSLKGNEFLFILMIQEPIGMC